jgi:glycosyltransferase involved in cell wall biosynthesis
MLDSDKYSFDVIIATYNRQDSLHILIDNIKKCNTKPDKIIVVDASSKQDLMLQNQPDIVYIHSTYANQPYQRYVGFLSATSPILVYFDDDMRITDNGAFDKLLQLFDDTNTVAVQPSFDYPHTFMDEKLPRSKFVSTGKSIKSKIIKLLKTFSGTPCLQEGQYWFCAIKGKLPTSIKPINWFLGPVFIVKREVMYKNFNFQLFDLYSMHLGKGEDAVTGFTVAQQGDILYYPYPMFCHDPNYDSVYSPNQKVFGRRYLSSRLYHSFEYARLMKKSKLLAFLHYQWYAFWRIVGLILNQLIGYKTQRNFLLLGYIQGWMFSLIKLKDIMAFNNGNKWRQYAKKDANLSE